MWYLLTAWLASNAGFVVGLWWATRPLPDIHDRVRTTLKVHGVTGRAVYIPDDPLMFMAEETLHGN